MTQTPDGGTQDRLRLKAEAARVLYDSLTKALKARIQTLESGGPDPDNAKLIASELTQHRKALALLIEHEVKLDGPDRRSGADTPIDLGAARDELRARILGLRNRG